MKIHRQFLKNIPFFNDDVQQFNSSSHEFIIVAKLYN